MNFDRMLVRRILPFVVAAVPLSSQAQVPTAPVGGQFQANTYTSDGQSQSSVSTTAEGDFIIVWQSSGSGGTDVSSLSIQGQRYASDGSAAGTEFQVNTYTSSFQRNPSVAAVSDGDFVVVWDSDGSDETDTSSLSIQGQRFTSDGSTAGGQFQVNTTTANAQAFASVAMGPDGDFVVVWWSSSVVRGQRFDSNGVAVGAEFRVDTTGLANQPAVARSSDGAFVVVWDSYASAGNDTDITGIQGRRYASDGTAVSGQFQVNSYTTEPQALPSVAMTPNGDFVVVWQSRGSSGTDSSGYSVQGQRYASDGSEVGGEFQINTYEPANQTWPSVSSDSDGDFVVVWQSWGSSGTDSSSYSVQGQRFSSDGAPVGGEFQVNVYSPGEQSYPSVSTDADGDFIVTWQSSGSNGSDLSDFSAQGQRIRVTADIGDRVWLDEDFDGLQGSEPGIEGVMVHLFDEPTATLLATTETDATGAFVFRPKVGLEGAADEFFLSFEAPRRFSFTPSDVGGDDALDSDADVLLGTTESFLVVSAADDHRDLDAGLANGIGDRVWSDLDGNGIQDGGEPGVPGVAVELFDALGGSHATTATDADGRYSFPDLDAGSYYLAFSAPTGFVFTARDLGTDDALDSDVNPVSGTTSIFSLPIGGIETGWDAGLVDEPSTMVQIGDRVWLDVNGNGLQDGGEPGVENVTVTLRSEAAPPRGSDPIAVTDFFGYYTFAVEPGYYYLEFTLPADRAFVPRDRGASDELDSDVDPGLGTTPAFTAAAGSVSGIWDAGIEPATIGNRVWLDSSGDGRQQPGEPGIGGVTVHLLDDGGALVASTTTGEDGVYGFLGIPDGVYRIEVVLPTGGDFSVQDAGDDDLLDSDVDPSDGRTASFPYVAGTGSRSHDAGLLFPPLFEDGFESGGTSAWSG